MSVVKQWWCVYRMLCLVNDKPYIGKGAKNGEDRLKAHRYASNNPESDQHKLIHRAIHKHGITNFSFEVLETFDTEEKAFEREIYWIAFYKCNAARYGSKAGYNLTDGGKGAIGYWNDTRKQKKSESSMGDKNAFFGKHHTEETRQLISVQLKEFFATHPNPNLGRKASDETRRRISEAHKGLAAGEKNPMFGVRLFGAANGHFGKKMKPHVKATLLNHRRKLSDKQLVEIKSLYATGDYTQTALAKEFAISLTTIHCIIKGKTWAGNDKESLVEKPNMTLDDAREIKRLYATGKFGYKALAKQFKCSAPHIGRIVRGIKWKDA